MASQGWWAQQHVDKVALMCADDEVLMSCDKGKLELLLKMLALLQPYGRVSQCGKDRAGAMS